VTQRSVLTTQSKLTVQAPSLGSGVPGQSDVPVAWPAVHILVHCPVLWGGHLNGSLLFCLRKDVALCHTASLAWVEERSVGETAHLMCTVYGRSSVLASWGRFLCSIRWSRMARRDPPYLRSGA
jgi:hypothetical protein